MELQLKRFRLSSGLTQNDMASALGVKVRTYGSWERQEVSIPFPAAIECANLLGCTFDELAGRAPAEYADRRQGAIGECYANMNEQGRDMLARLARSMERDVANRIEKRGKNTGGESAARPA